MKTLTKPYFIIFSGIFLIVYFLQCIHFPLPSLINNYLNDFLCMPIVLTLCLAFVRFIKKNPGIQLSVFVIFSVTIYYSVYFEYYLPKVNARYTADPIDVLLYFAGAFIFYLLQKKTH